MYYDYNSIADYSYGPSLSDILIFAFLGIVVFIVIALLAAAFFESRANKRKLAEIKMHLAEDNIVLDEDDLVDVEDNTLWVSFGLGGCRLGLDKVNEHWKLYASRGDGSRLLVKSQDLRRLRELTDDAHDEFVQSLITAMNTPS